MASHGELAFQKNVSKVLYQFGETMLRASPHYYDEGHRLGQKLFLTLQRQAKHFSVAEPHFNGSFGKKTDVVQPDLDLVIIMNNFMPPDDLPKVIDEIHDILLLNLDELQIIGESIQCRKRLIQFTFKNGIEVDLVPAPNLKEPEAYQLMAKNPTDYQTYNVCVGTKQVHFIKSHPQNFVHALIRVLKYWYKSLVGLGKIAAGSSLMEVVAVASAEMEDTFFEKPDMCRAFVRAIEWFMKLNTMKIAFEEVEKYKWKLIPQSELGLHNAKKLVPNVIGTRDILAGSSFIVDPANPYSDWLNSRDPEEIRKLMEYATVTKKRFDALFNRDPKYIWLNNSTNIWEIDILHLFRTIPFEAVTEFPISLPKDFLVSCQVPTTSQTNSKVVRKERTDLPGVKNYLLSAKHNLLGAVQISNHGTGKSVESVVEKFLANSLNTQLGTAHNNKKHEDYDVTLMVPYHLDGKTFAVKYSMSW